MVGLPYPDKRDAELKQKMAYLDEASPARYAVDVVVVCQQTHYLYLD